MRIFLKHERESDLIRDAKVAAFPGDGRGVASRLRFGRKSCREKYFKHLGASRHGGKPFLPTF